MRSRPEPPRLSPAQAPPLQRRVRSLHAIKETLLTDRDFDDGTTRSDAAPGVWRTLTLRHPALQHLEVVDQPHRAVVLVPEPARRAGHDRAMLRVVPGVARDREQRKRDEDGLPGRARRAAGRGQQQRHGEQQHREERDAQDYFRRPIQDGCRGLDDGAAHAMAQEGPAKKRAGPRLMIGTARPLRSEMPSCLKGRRNYFGTIFESWLATHCHCPPLLIHVSVHGYLPLLSLPLYVLVVTLMPVATTVSP